MRGVYGEVNQLFNGTADKALRKKYSPVIRSLHAARELAEILKARAKRSGTVELDSTESRFVLDGQGAVSYTHLTIPAGWSTAARRTRRCAMRLSTRSTRI